MMNVMKKTILTLLISMALLVNFAQAQCPRGETNCTGKCGRFINENGDVYCDLGKKISETEEAAPVMGPENGVYVKKEMEIKTDTIRHQKAERITAHSPEKEKIPAEETAVQDSSMQSTQEAPVQEKTNLKAENPSRHKSPYLLVPILMILIVLYILTLFLVNKEKIKLATHRKIWNIGLTVTFLVSGILGLVMAFMINYGHIPDFYRALLKIHVDFGIAMAIIAIFHLLWHLNYYKTILKIKCNK